MKIVFWLPAGFLSNIGGVETLSLSLAKGLIQLGHQITVICFDTNTNLIPYEKIDLIEIFRFPSIQIANAKAQLETYRKIKQILIEQNSDIFHLHYTANSNLAYYFLLQKYITIPQVMTIHGVLNHTEHALLKKSASHMSHIVCVSNALKRQVTEILFDIPKASISMIYNALEITAVPCLSSNTPFTFLCLGRLTEEKGYDLAIKAFTCIQKKYSHIRLLIVGDGPESSKLKKLAPHLNIDFKPAVSVNERLDIIAQSHVVLVPSSYESFGLVALEAGLLGRSVIASKTGGLVEIVDDGITGLLFPSQDVEQLAVCMESLILNENKAMQMGKQASKSLNLRFNFVSMLDQYEQLYNANLALNNIRRHFLLI